MLRQNGSRRSKRGLNSIMRAADEMRGLGTLDGGVRSQIRTRLHLLFPANRVINREFCDFGRFGDNFLAESRCAAVTSSEIP